MTYSPKRFPDREGLEERLLEVIEFFEGELEQIARSQTETNVLELREIDAEPAKPREGMIIRADGTNFDPGSGKGVYEYRNGGWVFLASQGLEAYTSMIDGTNTATPGAAGSPFKFRAGPGLSSVVTNDDATHGDNVLDSLDFPSLVVNSTPLLTDEVPYQDVGTGPRRSVWSGVLNMLRLFGAETTLADADSFPFVDDSASAMKRITLPNARNLFGLEDAGSASVVGTPARLTVTSIADVYKFLLVEIYGISATANGLLEFLTSDDGAVTFNAGFGGVIGLDGGAGGSNAYQADATLGVPMEPTNETAGSTSAGWIVIPQNNETFRMIGGVTGGSNAGGGGFFFAHLTDVAGNIDAVGVENSAGNLDAGSIQVWGMR